MIALFRLIKYKNELKTSIYDYSAENASGNSLVKLKSS